MEKYRELTGSKGSPFSIPYAPGDADEPAKGRARLREMAHVDGEQAGSRFWR